MAHIVHCRICKMNIDIDKQDDWLISQPRWYYHKSCYNDFAKKQDSIKEKDLTIEVDDEMWLDATYKYLQRDLKMTIDFVKMKRQWESYLKKGMTAKGIYFTLRYFYETKHGDTSKSESGIGIIPYIYNEATTYWGERNQRDKNICKDIEEQVKRLSKKEIKVVNIPKVRKNTTRQEIDLSTIETG